MHFSLQFHLDKFTSEARPIVALVHAAVDIHLVSHSAKSFNMSIVVTDDADFAAEAREFNDITILVSKQVESDTKGIIVVNPSDEITNIVLNAISVKYP